MKKALLLLVFGAFLLGLGVELWMDTSLFGHAPGPGVGFIVIGSSLAILAIIRLIRRREPD